MNVIEIQEIKKAIEIIDRYLEDQENEELLKARGILYGLIEFKDIAIDQRWPND